MVQFHDPRGEVAGAVEPYTLSVDLGRQNDLHIGFLANGFPDSERFLNEIASVMNEQFSGMTQVHENKGNASIPAPDEILDSIQGSCQAAIAAYGH